MFQHKKILLAAILLFTSFAYAQKIKVAYYPSKNFSEGTTDSEMKSGYCYEYLQILSAATGWTYEYVYGEWPELYDKFIAGEIDLFPGLSYSEEREKYALFPKMPMGSETYHIYTSSKNSKLRELNTIDLNNKKIGTVRNTLFSDSLKEWSLQNNINCEEISFNSYDLAKEALYKGKIDAVVNTNNNVSEDSDLVPLKMIGGSAFYLAVSKNRPDVYGKVMDGVSSVLEANPYFTQVLQQKYFDNTLVSSFLTKEEIEYLKTKGVLKIGYLNNFRPFCDKEKDGSVYGIVEYLANSLIKMLHYEESISLEYYSFDNYTDLFEALREKQIDFVFPVYDNLWFSENVQIRQSIPIASIDSNLIIREGTSPDKISKIGVTRTNWFQGVYVTMNYPDYDIVLYDSDEACLKAIMKNEVDCTAFNIFRSNMYLGRQKYRRLTGIPTSKPANLCFGTNSENIYLMAVLNKGIHVMGAETIKDKLYEFSKEDQKFSLIEYFMDNLLMFSSIILVVVGGFLATVNYYIYKMKKSKRELEGQIEIVEALSRNYLFVFLIDLVEQSCIIVKLDGKFIDQKNEFKDKVYPYQEMINRYVKGRVYNSDQENLLNALKADVVKEKLAENNEYSYNYRVFENEDVHSYQASFLRLKCKDGTEKVILAFQNIDDIVAASKERELLKIKAEADPLTELLNRKCGEEMVTEALVERKTGGMFLSLKIKNFEEVNNRYGHSVGDSVLIFVSDCLKKAFRAGDVLFRSGGDDFSVLAFNIETEDAGRRVIERLFNRLEDQSIPELEDFKITVCAGAKIIKKDELITFDMIDKRTNKCLMECKDLSGNNVLFSE